MARNVSNQVAHRNAAGAAATAALETRRAAHAVVVDLEARVAAADAAWRAASASESAQDDAAGVDWLDALLNAGDRESDALYATFESLSADLEAARLAHAEAVAAHESADRVLAAAEDVILRDRSARFRRFILPHLDD